MNNYPRFSVSNPLSDTIREGEDIIRRVEESCARLQYAIRREADLYAVRRDAQAAYDAAEGEELGAVFALAQGKEGPLGGLAKTSKEYDLALQSIRARLRANGLRYLADKVDGARDEHESVQAERAMAETEFKALRLVAELKAAILRAATI